MGCEAEHPRRLTPLQIFSEPARLFWALLCLFAPEIFGLAALSIVALTIVLILQSLLGVR